MLIIHNELSDSELSISKIFPHNEKLSFWTAQFCSETKTKGIGSLKEIYGDIFLAD